MPRVFVLLVLAMITINVVSCSPRVATQKAELDTPARHVENGIKLLNYGKVQDAYREFSRALELDHRYAPAHVGLGFCYGLMGDYEQGIKTMQEAQKYLQGKGKRP